MKSFADILREEGMEKGEQKNNRKIIRNAIKAGVDIDTITQITGLSKKEVEKIIEEMEQLSGALKI